MVFNQETFEPFFGGPERSVAIRADTALALKTEDAIKASGEASRLLIEKLSACRELDIKFASSNVPVDDSYPHSSKNLRLALIHVYFCIFINYEISRL